MEHLKTPLAKSFKLPFDLITEKADLYTLDILSLFFSEGQATDHGIKIDIDPIILGLTRRNLRRETKNAVMEFCLQNILRTKLPVDLRKADFYEDHIGPTDAQTTFWKCCRN